MFSSLTWYRYCSLPTSLIPLMPSSSSYYGNLAFQLGRTTTLPWFWKNLRRMDINSSLMFGKNHSDTSRRYPRNKFTPLPGILDSIKPTLKESVPELSLLFYFLFEFLPLIKDLQKPIPYLSSLLFVIFFFLFWLSLRASLYVTFFFFH